MQRKHSILLALIHTLIPIIGLILVPTASTTKEMSSHNTVLDLGARLVDMVEDGWLPILPATKANINENSLANISTVQGA